MKMRIMKDYNVLDGWKRNPHGIAVVMLSENTKLEMAEVGKRIELVRVTGNDEKVLKKLEKLREDYDADPNGVRPRLVVLSESVENDVRAEQFLRRATLIFHV